MATHGGSSFAIRANAAKTHADILKVYEPET